MKPKEQWINEVLNSLDNIQTAKLSDQVTNKIIKQVQVSKGKLISIQPSMKWAVAASIILLIGLNILSILYDKKSSAKQYNSNPVYQEYFSYLNNL